MLEQSSITLSLCARTKPETENKTMSNNTQSSESTSSGKGSNAASCSPFSNLSNAGQCDLMEEEIKGLGINEKIEYIKLRFANHPHITMCARGLLMQRLVKFM